MIIKKLSINNLQLIKSAQVDFDKVNLVSGINKDSSSESGNGSGKSTLVLRAILFCLYGYVEEGLTLKDLIRFGEKECSVECTIVQNNEQYKIIRTIPTQLQIFKNDVEIQANTNTIKQKIVDDIFGDINFFRQYRCCDLKNGISVLDLGIVSLRKTLMGFIEGIFTEIRTQLLAKKCERERYSIDKKLYKHYLSTKRKCLLENGLNKLLDIKKELQQSIRESQLSISKVNGEISAQERIISYKKNETAKAKDGICPVLRTKCEKISKSLNEKDNQTNKLLSQEIEQLFGKIEQLKESIIGDQDYLADLEIQLQGIDCKIEKVRHYTMRLESAFKFVDYKYTKADIIIYDEAIKILDTFAGEYIKEWLGSLSIIMNNLLNLLNIRIEFVADKDFLHVYDNGQILKYDSLSTGQKCFLSVIFKLAILMQQNKSGIVLMDDGLNNLDAINLTNLISICKTLPFQIIAVYQSKVEIEDVKQFLVVREGGQSNVQMSS